LWLVLQESETDAIPEAEYKAIVREVMATDGPFAETREQL